MVSARYVMAAMFANCITPSRAIAGGLRHSCLAKRRELATIAASNNILLLTMGLLGLLYPVTPAGHKQRTVTFLTNRLRIGIAHVYIRDLSAGHCYIFNAKSTGNQIGRAHV